MTPPPPDHPEDEHTAPPSPPPVRAPASASATASERLTDSPEAPADATVSPRQAAGPRHARPEQRDDDDNANADRGTGRHTAGRPAAGSPYPESLRRVMEEFARLPGIGPRSAERMAFHLLKARREDALRLASAIQLMKQHVRHCSICFNLTERDLCPICRDPRRDAAVVLVVEQPKDLLSLEQTGMFHGTYHVLMGHIAPLEGIGPEDLTVDRLLERIDRPETNAQQVSVREVVFGLSPNLEGDGTVLYLSDVLRHRPGVRLTRLARGLPSGSSLEFASKAVLADAIVGRQGVPE